MNGKMRNFVIQDGHIGDSSIAVNIFSFCVKKFSLIFL